MPAATTHVIFSDDVLKQLPENTKKEIRSLPMFHLGSQGPDMLFFSRGSVLPGSLKKYGDLMHNVKVAEVISFFDRYISEDSDLRSYLYGYLCHYALDQKVHPLVEAMSKAAHDETGVHKGAQHVTYEANIDVWLLQQRGRTIYSYDVYKHLKIDRSCRRRLAEMYHAMLKEVFGIRINSANLNVAIAEVPFWNEFLKPSKAKNDFLIKFEDVMHLPHAISGIVLYDKHDFSIINLEHKSYPLAYDAELTISKSFPELYGEAITLARNLIAHHEEADFDKNFLGIPKSYGAKEKA